MADLKKDVDGFWEFIKHGWEIEPREWFEAKARSVGFAGPLAMAAHHMWKRELRNRGGFTFPHTHTNELSQQIIDAMNDGRWQDATHLLIEKVDDLYRERDKK